jgi:hypothetical protein
MSTPQTNENDGREFELAVLRIARARWPQDEFGGAFKLHGSERDGRFETEDAVHFIEATISRSLDKAKHDGKKLFDAVKTQQKQNPMKGSRGWLITKYEPTADQRTAVQAIGNHQVQICSLDVFQRSIIDTNGYLSARENHFFGSVLDPETRSIRPTIEYIPLDIIEQDTNQLFSINDICEKLTDGESFTLLGDYGAGKSMTLRQIFFKLQERYRSGQIHKFPIYINLREHSGQDDPAEVIERHARRIGFQSPSSLVRAWKAGFCTVILDGFDEITTLGASKRPSLKNIRHESVTAIRRLIEQNPHTGWILAGREHFFDSSNERRNSLGLLPTTRILTLNEFSESQVKSYIEKFSPSNRTVELPSWLPTRPLLVGYFATRGIFQELIESDTGFEAVDGWSFLIDRICERESRIGKGLDGQTLRTILERLATIARSTTDGLGPISQDQIRSSFIDVCQYEPDDQANLILQRMPGLGVFRVEEDTRAFVDAALAEICRAGDIIQFLTDPYSTIQNSAVKRAFSDISSYCGDMAAAKVARLILKKEIKDGHLSAALRAIENEESFEALKADLFGVCQISNICPTYKTTVNGIVFEGSCVTFEEPENDLSYFTFIDCFFEKVELSPSVDPEKIPTFSGCAISEVVGRQSFEDLPNNKFDHNCIIESFSASLSTQSAILGTTLTKGEKLVLSILRKLFVQSLGGRVESALSRGLDLNDRSKVPDAIRLIQQHGFSTCSNRGNGDVWIPNRKRLNEVRRILAAPTTYTSSLMTQAKEL